MPKVTKLHSTGRPKSIQKAIKPDGSTDQKDPEESLKEFQLQLLWCIQKLEKSIGEKKGNDKQLQEMWKALTILKNNNQPIIRKRQLMRKHLGDYRAKMAAEEKALVKMASKIKIADSPVQPKATFLRKSAFLSNGDNSFKFNFNVPEDKNDSNNASTDKLNAETNESENGNTESESTDKSLATDKTKENLNKCKFSTGSEFRFNFKVDDKE